MVEGDIVVLFLGGGTPFILHPLDNGSYRFVGECYIDGIMYGQAFDEQFQKEVLGRSLPKDRMFLLK